MKYGIIICNKCKNPKAAELNYKTTKCTRCGKTIKLDKTKIFYKTDSKEEITRFIGLLNADKDGKLEDFKTIYKK